MRKKDIFDIVAQRKRNILARQDTVDRREANAAEEEEKLKDPIYRETCEKTCRSRERKFIRRARILQKRFTIISDLTNKSFRCPSCQQTILETQRWCVNLEKLIAKCRVCFSVEGWSMRRSEIIKWNVFGERILRYPVNSISLCRMREAVSLSVEQFSSLVGWSASYQYDLENGMTPYVSGETMIEICQAFSRKGFVVEKTVWGQPTTRYTVLPDVLKHARQLRSISMRSFAIRAGWSSAYQAKLESGKIKSVTEAVGELINNIINLLV